MGYQYYRRRAAIRIGLNVNGRENQNFDRYQDLLPGHPDSDGLDAGRLDSENNCIPLHGMRMLAYLNSEGVICYRFKHAGDVALTQVIGLLEMVKADVLNVVFASGHRDSESTAGSDEDADQ